MKIYLIRHGEPNYQTDSLTPEGLIQANKLANKFKNIPIDIFYISTHGRACQTAAPLIKDRVNSKINYVDWAREDLGAKYFVTQNKWYMWIPEWTNLFKSQEIALYGNDWIKHPKIAKTLMPEGFKIMSETVDSFMLELGYKHDRVTHTYIKIKDGPNSVAIVAHGGFAFSFISNLLDIPYPLFTTTHCCMDCTAVTIIEIWDGIPAPVITKYNDTSHLINTEIEFKKLGV